MVAHALQALADSGVVHADLKPDNILVEYCEGQISHLKLIDFGSAFESDCANGKVTATTPEYLAPEVL